MIATTHKTVHQAIGGPHLRWSALRAKMSRSSWPTSIHVFVRNRADPPRPTVGYGCRGVRVRVGVSCSVVTLVISWVEFGQGGENIGSFSLGFQPANVIPSPTKYSPTTSAQGCRSQNIYQQTHFVSSPPAFPQTCDRERGFRALCSELNAVNPWPPGFCKESSRKICRITLTVKCWRRGRFFFLLFLPVLCSTQKARVLVTRQPAALRFRTAMSTAQTPMRMPLLPLFTPAGLEMALASFMYRTGAGKRREEWTELEH